MKKRISLIILVLAFAVVLCACGCDHDWEDATCKEPKTCAKCGETEGEPLEHEWEDATCEEPKTCSLCGKTKGKKADHEWEDATCEEPQTCEVCGETEGEALGHSWVDATTEAPKTCEVCGETEGDPLPAQASFTESEIYATICGMIDDSMGEMEPQYLYDEESSILYIYLNAPEGTAELIFTDPDALTDTWADLSANMCALSGATYDAFVASGYEVYCSILIVSDANADNVLLATLNDEVLYDVMAEE